MRHVTSRAAVPFKACSRPPREELSRLTEQVVPCCSGDVVCPCSYPSLVLPRRGTRPRQLPRLDSDPSSLRSSG